MAKLRKLFTGRAIPGWALLIWNAISAWSNVSYVAGWIASIKGFLFSPMGNTVILVVGIAWMAIVVGWPNDEPAAGDLSLPNGDISKSQQSPIRLSDGKPPQGSFTPNLQCGKIERLPVDISHDAYDLIVPGRQGTAALLLTIANGIPLSGKITYVNNVNAAISLYSTSDELLETVEVACWREGRPAVHFSVSGINHLVLFFWEVGRQEPLLLDRTHGQIMRKEVPDRASELLISLTSPHPVYQKRFHINLQKDTGPIVCSGESCDFCERFIFQVGR